MNINATYINIYNVCKRELWLHANEIRFEHTSDIVYDGKLIHEDSYPQRSSKYEEIEIDGIKVDYYDTKNKVIHEIKRSNKIELAHEWQLKYYMYVFEQHGVTNLKGILEYPTLRKTQSVVLSDVDRNRIKEIIADIERIISSDKCPPLQKKGICKNCSYYEFCFTKEIEE
jgi:CRISPR-associated exonuclease Cas4